MTPLLTLEITDERKGTLAIVYERKGSPCVQ